eukprot:gene10467-biopygen9342
MGWSRSRLAQWVGVGVGVGVIFPTAWSEGDGVGVGAGGGGGGGSCVAEAAHPDQIHGKHRTFLSEGSPSVPARTPCVHLPEMQRREHRRMEGRRCNLSPFEMQLCVYSSRLLKNGHSRVRSASVSLNSIVWPASGPRPLPFLPEPSSTHFVPGHLPAAELVRGSARSCLPPPHAGKRSPPPQP